MITMLQIMIIFCICAFLELSCDTNVTVIAQLDTCDYNYNNSGLFSQKSRCGDRCIDFSGTCKCGNSTFYITAYKHDKPYYCCISSGKTCRKVKGLNYENGICDQGTPLLRGSVCKNDDKTLQCHNSYEVSEHLGELSYFKCPNNCIKWTLMCQGFSWCKSDVNICGPQLRCPALGMKVRRQKANSNIAPNHHYCLKDIKSKSNDGFYDTIDRSDENLEKSDNFDLQINLAAYNTCVTLDNDPGALCGSTCLKNLWWCRKTGAVSCGSEKINTRDPRLCGNPSVWTNVSCRNYYEDRRVWIYGIRCTGKVMQCISPWYTKEQALSTYQTCDDKSDQKFTVGLSCKDHLIEHVNFHTKHFCNTSVKYEVQNDTLCTNKTEWLSWQDEHYRDPHHCQNSCTFPNPDCIACTNPNYFNCTEGGSGFCLHPELVCDGHPQCPGGEDENLKLCYPNHIKNRIMEPYASYKCKSIFYENMNIYATPCDDKIECYDQSDESFCKEEKTVTYILLGALLLITLFYVSLSHIFKSSKDEINLTFPLRQYNLNTLENYEANHRDPIIIYDVNIHLLNTILTKSVEVTTNTCRQFYELEFRIHEGKENEIFWCLHKNIDPFIVDYVIESKFPGILSRFINWIQDYTEKNYFTAIIDWKKRQKRLNQILAFFTRITSLQLKYFDQVKDTAMTFWILSLVGGTQSVIDFPSKFTSIIIILMFYSIIIPLLISSLHLSVNNPNVINGFINAPRQIRGIISFFCSWFHPILLTNQVEISKEITRQLAYYSDYRVIRNTVKNKVDNKKKLAFFKEILSVVRHITVSHFFDTYFKG